jgi:hypothetical protein
MQTIKNDDLEEIRELGSGTYGAVYHGKWRGCDVAVKRIKASCFVGRPSERERLVCLIFLSVPSILGFVLADVCTDITVLVPQSPSHYFLNDILSYPAGLRRK